VICVLVARRRTDRLQPPRASIGVRIAAESIAPLAHRRPKRGAARSMKDDEVARVRISFTLLQYATANNLWKADPDIYEGFNALLSGRPWPLKCFNGLRDSFAGIIRMCSYDLGPALRPRRIQAPFRSSEGTPFQSTWRRQPGFAAYFGMALDLSLQPNHGAPFGYGMGFDDFGI